LVLFFELFILNSAFVQVLVVLSFGEVDKGSVAVSYLVVLLVHAGFVFFLELGPVELEFAVVVEVVERDEVEQVGGKEHAGGVFWLFVC